MKSSYKLAAALDEWYVKREPSCAPTEPVPDGWDIGALQCAIYGMVQALTIGLGHLSGEWVYPGSSYMVSAFEQLDCLSDPTVRAAFEEYNSPESSV